MGVNPKADPSLIERAREITDIQDAAHLVNALAEQLGEAVTVEDACAVLMAAITQGGGFRDAAAGLWVDLSGSGGEG